MCDLFLQPMRMEGKTHKNFKIAALYTSFVLIVALLVVAIADGQVRSPTSVQNVDQIRIEAKVSSLSSKELKIDFSVANIGTESIYFFLEPVQQNRTKGFFITRGSSHGEVRIESRLYEPPLATPPGINIRTELKLLGPGETYSSAAIFKWPLSSTYPPVYDYWNDEQFAYQDTKSIKFSIAYFPESSGIRSLLDLRKYGWFVHDMDHIPTGANRGKRLLELQQIVSSSIDLTALK